MATDHDAPIGRAQSPGSLALRSHRDGDTHILELHGELDIAGAPGLDDELRRIEETDATAIVCDLSSLEFIDSSGIRVLIMAADRSAADGRLTLRQGPEQVQRVFEITDLLARLPFADA